MIFKNTPLFPLTWKQAIQSSIVLSNLLFLAVILTTIHNLFHPLMILAVYFLLYGVTRAVSDDFENWKNPELMMRAVVGPFQILSGAAILTCVIVRGPDVGVFWIGATLILIYFGIENWAGAVYIWEVEAFERQQEKRVMDRLDAFAAQDAREASMRQEEAAIVRKNEEAMIADLTAFLADSNETGKGGPTHE